MSGFDKDKFMAGVPAKNRNGDIVIFDSCNTGDSFPLVSTTGEDYAIDGRYYDDEESPYDLIEMVEHQQPQSEQLTFRDRVFLAALSGIIARADIEYMISEVDQAWQYADEAVKQRGEQK